jgi:hypothetical protein
MNIMTAKEAIKIAEEYFAECSEEENDLYVMRGWKKNKYIPYIYEVFFYAIPKSINKTLDQLTEAEKEEYSYISLADGGLPYQTGKVRGFVIIDGQTGTIDFPKY